MTKRRLIELLWENIENGTIDKNFFELREYVRNALKPPSVKKQKVINKLHEWRKANGKWNTGRPPRHDWPLILGDLGHLTIKQAAQKHKCSENAIYMKLRKNGRI